MVQHIVVNVTPEGQVHISPSVIQIFRDDQFIRFSLAADAIWGSENPIIFGDGWPGGAATFDVCNTYLANGNFPLPEHSEAQKYSVTINALHVDTHKGGPHDPEIKNQPQP